MKFTFYGLIDEQKPCGYPCVLQATLNGKPLRPFLRGNPYTMSIFQWQRRLGAGRWTVGVQLRSGTMTLRGWTIDAELTR